MDLIKKNFLIFFIFLLVSSYSLLKAEEEDVLIQAVADQIQVLTKDLKTLEKAVYKKSDITSSSMKSSELNEEKDDSQPIFEPEETPQNTIFSSDDIKYARALGLEQPFESKDIKTTYRKIIAQYHPDRVIAMGPEIQEVAEKKAKEINEAYEHLRKSLNLS